MVVHSEATWLIRLLHSITSRFLQFPFLRPVNPWTNFDWLEFLQGRGLKVSLHTFFHPISNSWYIIEFSKLSWLLYQLLLYSTSRATDWSMKFLEFSLMSMCLFLYITMRPRIYLSIFEQKGENQEWFVLNFYQLWRTAENARENTYAHKLSHRLFFGVSK